MTMVVARISELAQAIEETRALIQEGKYDEAFDKLRPSEGSNEANKEVRERAREQIKEIKRPVNESNNQSRENMRLAKEANDQAKKQAEKQIQAKKGKNLINSKPSSE